MEKPLDHLAWCHTARGKMLHCVPDTVDETGLWHDDFLDAPGMDAAASCGRRARFFAPGIFTRMYMQRCPICCDYIGIPQGSGTPRNEASSTKKCKVEPGVLE